MDDNYNEADPMYDDEDDEDDMDDDTNDFQGNGIKNQTDPQILKL